MLLLTSTLLAGIVLVVELVMWCPGVVTTMMIAFVAGSIEVGMYLEDGTSRIVKAKAGEGIVIPHGESVVGWCHHMHPISPQCDS
jgi:hypothetical protein